MAWPVGSPLHRGIAIVGISVLGFGLAACDSAAAPERTSTSTSNPPAGASTSVVAAACDGTTVRSSPGSLQRDEQNETSGLVVSAKNPGTLWMNNDSGDSARVFAVATNGTLQGTYALDGATAIDWEDIAMGPGPKAGVPYLYVGDIGDNAEARPNVVVYRVAEPKVVGGGGTHDLSDVAALTLTYPDGAHDAEALMIDPGDGALYIIIKRLSGGPAGVYRAPGGLDGGSTTELSRVGEVDLPRIPFAGAVTAADISRDRRAIGVRTYGGVRLWSLGPTRTVIAALGATACNGPTPAELQGEALGLQPDARGYFTVSEGKNVPIHEVAAPGAR